VAATGSADLDAYRARLEREPAELTRLIDALAVHVTSFFRDPRVFEALAARVVPSLVRATRPDGTIRAWVVGASTGEEAYSLAMVLGDDVWTVNCTKPMGNPRREWEVLASDVDAKA